MNTDPKEFIEQHFPKDKSRGVRIFDDSKKIYAEDRLWELYNLGVNSRDEEIQTLRAQLKGYEMLFQRTQTIYQPWIPWWLCGVGLALGIGSYFLLHYLGI